MTTDASRILEQALALPEDERALLADQLFASLDPEAEAGVEAAWQEEILRRIEKLDSGRAETIRWEDLRAQMRGRSHEG